MVCVSAYNPGTFPWNSIERWFQMRIWAAVFSYVQVKSSQLSKTFQTILQIREEILQKILIEWTSATFLLTIYIIPISPYCHLSWLICKLMGCNRKLFEVKQICLDCKVSVMILRKKTCWQHIHSFKNAEFTDLLLEIQGCGQNHLPIHTRWKTNKKLSSAVPASVQWNSDTSHLEVFFFQTGFNGERISVCVKLHVKISLFTRMPFIGESL